MDPVTSPLTALVRRLIPGIRYPWLLVLLAGLLAVDLVVPDPVPLLDETVLAVLTFLVAAWRTREHVRPPPRDVTPEENPSPPVLPKIGTGKERREKS